jgi:hypothetical protein
MTINAIYYFKNNNTLLEVLFSYMTCIIYHPYKSLIRLFSCCRCRNGGADVRFPVLGVLAPQYYRRARD